MSLAAHEVGAHLITISTDYVFDGKKGEAYVEYDEAHPLNVYGASKFEGEQRCAQRRHDRANLVGHGRSGQERHSRDRRASVKW